MSCISVSIRALAVALRASAKKLDETLDAAISRIGGGIDVSLSCDRMPLLARVEDKNNHLNVTCGIVCSTGDFHYLRVSPHEVQWITPDEAIVYMVESDTSWTIITS